MTAGSSFSNARDRVRAALEANGTGTFDCNTATGRLEDDVSLRHLFGLNERQNIADLDTFLSLVDAQDRDGVRAEFERSARERSEFSAKFRVKRPDGAVRWLYTRGKAFSGDEGSVYITGTCQDFTARKESERMLEERARLAMLGSEIGLALTQALPLRPTLQLCSEVIQRQLQAAFARIWTVSEDGQTLELQGSAGMYTHIDGAHARVPVGKFKIGLIAEERLPHLTNDVPNDPRVSDQEWARREGMIAFAGYPLTVGERLVGVVAIFSRTPLGDDALRAFAAIANHLALGIERARSRADLARSQARKAAVLETALDGFVTIDSRSCILEFNSAAERIFGYRREDVIGKPMPELIMPLEAREPHYRGLKRYLDTGAAVIIGRRLELTGLRADGSEFPMELSVNAISEDGPPLFTATLRDITDRKQTEAAIREAKNAAEAANRAKSDFLASMSHELRTPLNAIIGYGEMLQEEAEDQGATNLIPDLQKVHSAGRHLLALINDILDLSKIEAGRMELYLEDFAVAPVAVDASHVVQPQIERNGNTLEVKVHPGVGEMRADLIKVRQSLFNLVSNAAKFTLDGRVRVEVLPDPENADYILFRVSDTGVGISPEQRDRLFEAFQQADTSVSRRFGGTGLGLALTQRFCRMMGGEVTVESVLGQGSTFTMRLPRVVKSETAPVEKVEAVQQIPAGARGTVLIIDDDPTACDLIKRLVRKEGYHAVTALTGTQGLHLARELRPTLITLDVMMPQMDGWTVLSALKNAPELANIPVVMLTMVDDRNTGYSLGAADYLTKPVEREQLSAVLRKHACPNPPCAALIVDDDKQGRRKLQQLLEREGWSVLQAENGREALDRIAQQRPELILLDLMMPVMDGFEFSLELRRNPAWRNIPVVVLTAKDLTEEDRRRLNGHVESVLRKDAFSVDQLLSEVRQAILSCSVRMS